MEVTKISETDAVRTRVILFLFCLRSGSKSRTTGYRGATGEKSTYHAGGTTFTKERDL